MHVVDRSYGALIESDNEVSLTQSGDRGWTVGFDGDDLHGLRDRQRMAPRDDAVDRPRLPDDSKVGTADTAPSEQLTYHPLGGVNRNGEADALGHANDGRVDSDHPCPRVNQGAAGVARVQRDVGLNDVLDQLSRATSQGSTKGADHTRRYGRLKPERIADGDDELSSSQRSGLSKLSDRKSRTVGPNHGEVGRRVAADGRRPKGGPIGQGDAEILRFVHHVAVGQDISVRREDHTRTRADDARSPTRAAASGGDAHNRGADVLHDRDDRSRVGVQEPAIVDAAGSISLERPDGPRRLVDLGTCKESVDHHSGLSTEKMPGWASRVHPTIRRARIRQRPTFGTLDARRRALDSAGAPRSGRVSLDGLLVSDACFVRVEPRRPPRPSLAKQVPALVQRHLEPPEPLTVGVGHPPMRFTLEQLVLLACKLVDPAEDLVNVHNASPPSSRNHRLRPRRSRGPGRGGRRGGSVPFDS